GQAHTSKQLDGTRLGGFPLNSLVCPHDLGDLLSDGVDRVQARPGVLEDHRDSDSSDPIHLFLRLREELLAEECNRSPADYGVVRQETKDGEGRDRLSTTRLSHESE